MIKILGIETSCDETSAAVITDHEDPTKRILSNIVLSQIKEHEPFGGVIPEIAARNHLFHLPQVVEDALKKANTPLEGIDGIAVTAGPGLIGGVLVGVMYAKGLSYGLKKPLYGINHLEGHALVPRLLENISFPFLLLLVSGGHCQFLKVHGINDYSLLGCTIDDAIGEAFDKIAKMMGLPYPGGPIIEQMAQKGNPLAFDLPKPLFHEKNANLSFSGLKTAVKNIIDKQSSLSHSFICDMSASFQDTVAKILVKKTQPLLESECVSRMVIAGGVAANQHIKREIDMLCKNMHVQLHTPPLTLCTDNAAMIAWAGIEHIKAGNLPSPFVPRPRWPLFKD